MASRRPLSIVHVVVSLQTGGAERMVVDLARTQAARGHRVAVFSLTPSPQSILLAPLAEAGVAVQEVPRGSGVDLSLLPRLARALLARRPDVVHTHNEPPLIYAAPAGRLVRARVIHTCHGPRHLTRGAAALARISARLVHGYVACTGALLESLQADGDVPRGRLVTIENGIDLERFSSGTAPDAAAAVRRRFGIPPEAFVIGSVGRLAVEKNYGFLMRAAAPLLGAGAHLLFVGDGAERPRLEAQAAASGAPGAIHFAGAQSDVAPFHAALDLFALSSTFEGLPLALLEAMASARPVVAPAVGGIPLVVEDGRTGLLAPPGDEPAFTAALQRIASDRALARALGEAGRARAVARYGLGRMVDAYMDLYGPPA
jgi:glycosyltransferase involved in cell wall biosynthesis